jgi:hypothetical protein
MLSWIARDEPFQPICVLGAQPAKHSRRAERRLGVRFL